MQLDQLINEAAGVSTPPASEDKPLVENQPPVDGSTPVTEVEQTPPDKEGASTQSSEENNQTPSNDDKSKPNPMKELRDKYNQTQKDSEFRNNTMEKFYNGDYKFNPKDYKTEDGKIDYQALNKAMEDADNEALAKDKGITPEMQAEITRIENEKIELRKQQLKVAMDRGLADMQVALGLNRTDINKFFSDSLAVQKNPYQWLAQGGSLTDLYNLVYHDKILKDAVDKAVAEAKAKWDSDNNTKPPISNPANPSSDNSKDGLSLQELLSEALKK